jgi:hypothetical protein
MENLSGADLDLVLAEFFETLSGGLEVIISRECVECS